MFAYYVKCVLYFVKCQHRSLFISVCTELMLQWHGSAITHVSIVWSVLVSMPTKRGEVSLTTMPMIEVHPIFILVQLPMNTLYPRVAKAAAEALVNGQPTMSYRLPEETVAYNELLALMKYSAIGIATAAFQEFFQRQMGRLHYSGITQV